MLHGLSLHPSTVLGRQLGIGLYVSPSERDNIEQNKPLNIRCISRTYSVHPHSESHVRVVIHLDIGAFRLLVSGLPSFFP